MPVRVLIVDDSPTARLALRQAIETDPSLIVVGEATCGAEALELVASAVPDIITMDVYLRHESGIDVAAAIMASSARPILIVTGVNPDDPQLVYRAVDAGAMEVTGKLPGPSSPSYEQARQRLLRLIKVLAAVPVVQRRRAQRGQRLVPPGSSTESAASAASAAISAGATSPTAVMSAASCSPMAASAGGSAGVGISASTSTIAAAATATGIGGSARRPASRCLALLVGASTGGPPVVMGLLQSLPPPLPIPVVMVQHICAGFTAGFANWLAETTRHVVEVVDRPKAVRPGVVYLPDDDSHVVFKSPTVVAPDRTTDMGFQRPSIDLLFETAAQHLGGQCIAIVMTGMGHDGSRGLLGLRRLGATTIAQEPATCVVNSMPQQALALDAAELVLRPDLMGPSIMLRLGAAARASANTTGSAP